MPGWSSKDGASAVPSLVAAVGTNVADVERCTSYRGVPTSSVEAFQVRWTVPPVRADCSATVCVGASGSKPPGAKDSSSCGRDAAVPTFDEYMYRLSVPPAASANVIDRPV